MPPVYSPEIPIERTSARLTSPIERPASHYHFDIPAPTGGARSRSHGCECCERLRWSNDIGGGLVDRVSSRSLRWPVVTRRVGSRSSDRVRPRPQPRVSHTISATILLRSARGSQQQHACNAVPDLQCSNHAHPPAAQQSNTKGPRGGQEAGADASEFVEDPGKGPVPPVAALLTQQLFRLIV